jgi:4-carboxymuconolactone decarboxylase
MTDSHSRLPEDERLYEVGSQIRREVLGDEHVARSLAGAGEFSRVMQDFVTEHCWGAVWSRPGLGRRERSLVNIAMLAALNRSHELRVHVRGALRNGCTREEIQEVLLQTAIYCGVPAGMEAFRVTQAVLDEMEREADGPEPTEAAVADAAQGRGGGG